MNSSRGELHARGHIAECLSLLLPVQSYKRFLERGAAEPAEQCLGLNSLAIAYQCLGQLETALGFHAEHARLASDPRVRRGREKAIHSTPLHRLPPSALSQSRVVALCNVGLVHRELGNLDESDRCFQQAVEVREVHLLHFPPSRLPSFPHPPPCFHRSLVPHRVRWRE